MKIKVINVAILALGLNFPIVSIADTTQSTDQSPPSGTIAPVSQDIPISQLYQGQSEIVAWAQSTALKTFTYDYKNYQNNIQNLSGFFTDSGWKDFQNALNNSKIFDAVKEKKIVVSAVTTVAPILINPTLNEVSQWKVQIPLLVTYHSMSTFGQNNVMVTMVITRTPTTNAPQEIAISQYTVDTVAPKDSEKK